MLLFIEEPLPGISHLWILTDDLRGNTSLWLVFLFSLIKCNYNRNKEVTNIKSLLLGIIVSIGVLIIGKGLNKMDLAMNILMFLGVGGMLIAGIFSGAHITGDRVRANNYSETNEDQRRSNISTKIFAFSLPFLFFSLIMARFLIWETWNIKLEKWITVRQTKGTVPAALSFRWRSVAGGWVRWLWVWHRHVLH